ncbi:MAG: 50S ribosomal protein L9 [Gemmatales bacterium]|nr:50S ribosomal protein L9 [Gemmatales bacterium]MDW8386331.1 50S ribosomal protein L9 [Gemmatales bacterium]
MAAKANPTKKPDQQTQRTRKRNFPTRGPHGGVRLLLVEDIPNLGSIGDVVEVRPGYARNYLLPRGKATLVTEHNLRLVEQHKEKVRKAREAKLADLRMLAEQIARVTVTIEANANEEGHLYGSVGPQEISKALKGLNLLVEPDMIRMEGVIKQANALYEVDVHLAPEIDTKVKVAVIAQKEA